jgi:hypothetical protein
MNAVQQQQSSAHPVYDTPFGPAIATAETNTTPSDDLTVSADGATNTTASKGKSAIEVGTMAELIPTLDMLKAAVDAGELDAQIVTASETLRAGFVNT